MNVRELTEQLVELQLVRGEFLPVISEDGHDVARVEYNEDDEPCILIVLEDV